MTFESKTWGTYTWDEEKSFAQNVSDAQSANALIRSTDLQRYDDAIAELDSLSIKSDSVDSIVQLTQAEYDDIIEKSPTTIYIIHG